VTNSKLCCVAFTTIVFVQHIVGTTIAATLAGPVAAMATHETTTKPSLISFTVNLRGCVFSIAMALLAGDTLSPHEHVPATATILHHH